MKNKPTVLIAGATGFVGKELVNHLLSSNYQVKVITRNIDGAKKVFPEEVILLSWPHEIGNKFLPSAYSCDAIVNLVGANIGKLRWTKRNKNEILKSRIESIDMLAQLVGQMQEIPKVWLQASAIGFYGANTIVSVDEYSQHGEGFLAEVVRQWETELENYPLAGIRKVYLRFGIVISHKGGFLKQMKDAFNFGMGIIPGAGLQKMSWIHLNDLTNIIRTAIENENYIGPINVVSQNPISFNGFSNLLVKHTRAIFAIKIPAFVFSLILGHEKTKEMLLSNQDVIPKKLLEQKFTFEFEKFEQIFEKKINA